VDINHLLCREQIGRDCAARSPSAEEARAAHREMASAYSAIDHGNRCDSLQAAGPAPHFAAPAF